MKQKEFEELSKNELFSFNGCNENIDCVESWRAGYLYAKKLIDKWRNECCYNNFMDNVDRFCEDELDEFGY